MKYLTLAVLLAFCVPAHAAKPQESAELESIFIKGNKEFPQILYIIPWKDMKTKGHREQTLVLHSLYGNLFEPVYDEVIRKDERSQSATGDSR